MGKVNHDVVIVGGGLIGAAVAMALNDSGLDVLIIEARPQVASGDGRTLAMSYGSRLILDRLGIWQQLKTITPIDSIHVSQRGGFGRALLSAQEMDLPALGYVVRHASLQSAFANALTSGAAALKTGAEVTGMRSLPEAVEVEFRIQQELHTVSTKLIVIADGGASSGLSDRTSPQVREYGQDAVVGIVEISAPHGNRAYERFTPEGPIALLPLENQYALIWTAPPRRADRLLALPQAVFLEELQTSFGDRAGRFTSISGIARFPLTLRYVDDPVMPRAVLLGNAAQALHPIAGQGFNLGLRDAWDLGETLLLHGQPDPGNSACLARYKSVRSLDRFGGIALTHSLVKIFSNDIAPVRTVRGAALSLLELAPFAKRAFMQRMIFGALR